MANITYEQFESCCKKWNMTIDEGFRAMCFTSSVVNQNASNYREYTNNIHSNELKTIMESFKDNAMKLSNLYDDLNTQIYCMLEKHEEETT